MLPCSCRLCYLWEHDPAYREIWGKPPHAGRLLKPRIEKGKRPDD